MLAALLGRELLLLDGAERRLLLDNPGYTRGVGVLDARDGGWRSGRRGDEPRSALLLELLLLLLLELLLLELLLLLLLELLLLLACGRRRG